MDRKIRNRNRLKIWSGYIKNWNWSILNRTLNINLLCSINCGFFFAKPRFWYTTQWSTEAGQTTQKPTEGQITQWSKEGQTTQWSTEEGQTTQWSTEEGQATQWSKKDERTNNELQNIIHKTKDWVTRTPLKQGFEPTIYHMRSGQRLWDEHLQ